MSRTPTEMGGLTIKHNELDGLDGGIVGKYYHFTLLEHTTLMEHANMPLGPPVTQAAHMPTGGSAGQVIVKDSGTDWDVSWGSGSKIFRHGHTYAISGEIKVPSGDTDFIIPFFFSLASGQTANIREVRYSINSGTSATVKLQRNGGDITGYTGISVTTTPTATLQTQALSDNDEIALVVTAVSGTPKNMNFTIFIESTQ